jgi:hypothetical protein
VPLDPGVFEILLASEDSVRLVANGVQLPPDSVAILGRATSR